jgi:hypothetical protein
VTDAELTPRQQETLARVQHPGGRIEFRTGLSVALREQLDDDLEPIARRLGDDLLYLNKHTISTALGCEERYLAEEAAKFEWSTAKARGTIAHKAIEISANVPGTWAPSRLADEALAAKEQDNGIGDWLIQLDEVRRAELRSEVATIVAAYDDVWFPFSDRHHAVFERPLKAITGNRRIVLSAKPDLMLGRRIGNESRQVIVDLKTGRPMPHHRADLHFYALVATLLTGVPPRLVASSYLDSGELHTEDVTEELLWSAAARVVSAAGAIATLRANERDPRRITGPPCWYCPRNTTCEDGVAWIAQQDDSA